VTLDDLSLLLDAAQAAGDLATDLRRQGLKVEYKAGNSPVTNADLAVDALLTAKLREARPDYGWLSEETADDVARLSRKRLFVVDPIDGTRAFLNDRPWWAVSLAIVENDRPIAGVVYAPEVGETYAALAGEGATLNGQPIGPSVCSALEGCRLVGDPALYRRPEWPIPWPEMIVEPRNSTAYRICLVAAGAFDAAVAPLPKHDWDLAAGDLIATEAGAYVGDHLGQAFRYNRERPVQASLVCAAKPLAPLILERVRHIGAAN
jgi:myo-inositol-1(or 4)-monophosphatase